MSEVVEEAIKGLEATDILVDEIADVVQLPNVKLIAGATGVICLAGGAVLGYWVASRKLETKYSQIAEDEIEEMRQHFNARQVAREPKPDIDELTKKYQDIPEAEDIPEDVVVDPQKGDPMAVQPESTVVRDVPDYMKNADGSTTHVDENGELVNQYTKLKSTQNVFEDQPDPAEVGPGWDYATETKLRSAQNGAPFVIHKDELGEEDGWDCTTYTYFEGDDTLCNERDEILGGAERESMVNFSSTQLRFGHGSGEADVVYVRNPHLQQEFEIRKSEGRYAQEVLGFDDEEAGGTLRHSEIPRRRRPWDDA